MLVMIRSVANSRCQYLKVVGHHIRETDMLEDCQQIEEAVIDFVAQESSTPRKCLKTTSRLWHDPDIDGDDAAELMAAFACRFQVDMSEFKFDFHFGPQAAVNPVLYLWWCAFEPDKPRFVPITSADLVEAATQKKWHSP